MLAAMSITMMIWLSTVTGLPVPEGVRPTIIMASAERMCDLHYTSPVHWTRFYLCHTGDPDYTVGALYDRLSNTIYLPLRWSRYQPIYQSQLIHELVHFMQDQAGATYECQEDKERVAYVAQTKFLSELGVDLYQAFGVSKEWLEIRMSCPS